MSNVSWLIQYDQHRGAYRFGRSRLDSALSDMSPSEPAAPELLVAALRATGYCGQPALLAIPSQWCLSTSATLSSRRLARNRQAVAYAMEEGLPLSAEEVTCDFVTCDSEAFAVAADTTALLPIVRSLEEAGIAVATITPTALLLLERLSHTRHCPPRGVVLLAHDDRCDLFIMAAARPQQWRCLPLDTQVITRELATLLLTQADEQVLPVTGVNLTAPQTAALHALAPDIELLSEQLDPDPSLLAAAADMLERGKGAWIELRRGQIGQYDPYRSLRSSLRLLLGALWLTLAIIAAVAWARGNRYQTMTNSLNEQKIAIFQHLFPEARVPTGIRSRLESEHRKLLGMSGRNDQAPQLSCVSGFLVQSLDVLPADLRFRLLEMRWEETTAHLEGEVRRHGDVDLIASSLRAAGFTVAPPRTEQLSGEGVSFSLSISLLSPSSTNQ